MMIDTIIPTIMKFYGGLLFIFSVPFTVALMRSPELWTITESVAIVVMMLCGGIAFIACDIMANGTQ